MIRHFCHLCPAPLSATQAANTLAVFRHRLCKNCEESIYLKAAEAQRREALLPVTPLPVDAGRCGGCQAKDGTLREVTQSSAGVATLVVLCEDCRDAA